MDHANSRDMGFGVDLESGLLTSDEELSSNPGLGSKRMTKPVECVNLSSLSGVSPESVKVGEEAVAESLLDRTSVKEKWKKTSNKKPPKPPRPPRGPSLDAADQKLVREISELVMLKRARVERMKALKKMKAAKPSSSNSSLLAMVFTVLFCLLMFFHGMSCRNSPENLQGSSISAGPVESGLISVQFYPIPSAVIPNGSEPGSQSPNMVEKVSGSDSQKKVTRYAE